MTKDLASQLSHVSVGYKMLRAYSKWMIFQWYSRVEVKGEENIPHGHPYIMLPCHQNAVMDCVTVLALLKTPVVFFARSDMFSTPMKVRMMHALKIMPAYRHQEGWGNVKKNEENFNMAVEWLCQNIPQCIMPEGGQDEKHHLRAFVKGPYRIAIAAQQKMGNEPVYLLPIGIDHGDYDKSGYPLVIHIGKPIDMRAYMEPQDENAAVKLNRVRADAFAAVQQLMVDIPLEHYREIHTANYIYQQPWLQKQGLPYTEFHALQARRAITQAMSAIADENFWADMKPMCDKLWQSHPDILTLGIAVSGHARLCTYAMACVLLAPFMLAGMVLNAPMLALLRYARIHSAAGFAATVQYALWLLVSPLYHILAAVLLGVCTHSVLWALVGIVALPLLMLLVIKSKPLYRLCAYICGHKKDKANALKIINYLNNMLK